MVLATIKQKLSFGKGRSSLVRKNIIVTLVAKVVALITSFVIVPVTLDFLDAEIYGVWLTISSILYWFSFFNIGLGNGMRNYVSMSYSRGEYNVASQYISTTIFFLALIAIVLGVASVVALNIVDLPKLFNVSSNSSVLLSSMLVAVTMTLLLFVARILGDLYCALQLSSVNDVLGTLGNVISLCIVCSLAVWARPDLFSVVCAYTIPPAVIFIIAFIPTFRIFYKIRPKWKNINLCLGRTIVGKSLGFFAIQITSCLVIYGSSNLFITQFCGPTEVTKYGIAYKLFNLLTVAYLIYISPMWSAYTDAYVKGDRQWIKRVFNKSLKVWALMSLGGVLLIVIANMFYHMWIGNTVEIPLQISVVTCIYVCAFNLNTCLTALINGLNTIRVQIITSVVFTALYLVIVSALGSSLGVCGIIGSMAVCYLAMSAIHYYQCRLLIANKAKGIWNK